MWCTTAPCSTVCVAVEPPHWLPAWQLCCWLFTALMCHVGGCEWSRCLLSSHGQCRQVYMLLCALCTVFVVKPVPHRSVVGFVNCCCCQPALLSCRRRPVRAVLCMFLVLSLCVSTTGVLRVACMFTTDAMNGAEWGWVGCEFCAAAHSTHPCSKLLQVTARGKRYCQV